MTTCRLALVGVLVSFLLWSSFSPVFSQNIPAKDKALGLIKQEAQFLREQTRLEQEREKNRLAQLQRTASPNGLVQEISESSDVTPTENLPAFLIHDISIKGLSPPFDSHVETLKKGFINRALSKQDIRHLIRQITNVYLTQGYVTTRVVMKSQYLGSGKLELTVIEGKVHAVVFPNTSFWQRWTAFPGLEGSRLNIRDLEQGLDQLNRLNGNRITFKLEPTADQLGYTDVIIHNAGQSHDSVMLRYDAYNQSAITIYPNEISFSRENLLQANDVWWTRYSQAHQGQQQFSNTFGLDGSIPLGYLVFSASYSQYDYSSLVYGLQRNFISSGQTRTYAYSVQDMLARTQMSKLSVLLGLKVKETDSYIEDVKNDVGSHKLVIASLGPTYTHYLPGGVFTVGLEYQRGLAFLGATIDSPDLDSLTAPHAQFEKWTLNTTYMQELSFFVPLSFRQTFTGQWSKDPLYSTEQLGIGDFYTVRGFYSVYLQGESGLMSKTDVTVALTNNWAITAGMDAGVIFKAGGTDVYQERARDYLIGSALGVRYIQTSWSADLIYAKALTASSGLDIPIGKLYLAFSISIQ